MRRTPSSASVTPNSELATKKSTASRTSVELLLPSNLLMVGIANFIASINAIESCHKTGRHDMSSAV